MTNNVLKTLLGRRKLQLTVLLIGSILLITNNVILPKYEGMRYFREKTEKLKADYSVTLNYASHIDHHQQILPGIQKKTIELSALFAKWGDPSAIFNELKKIQPDSIRLIRQNIEKTQNESGVFSYTVSQLFEGPYEAAHRYVSLLNAEETPVITEICELINREPMVEDPQIQLKLVFKIYQVRE